MRVARSRVLNRLICGLILCSAGGCGIVSDLFDPGLALQFGLDSATIKPQQGVVLVAFNNTTRYPATFMAFESMDAVDLGRDSRNFSVEIEAGVVGNEVLDCPVGMIAPGSLEEDYSYDGLAATIETDAGLVSVTYGGMPLVSGDAYSCGDVVEIRLSTTGAGEEQEYVVSVQVIPGR